MNLAHIHLVVNHLPVVGMLFSLGLLSYAYFRGSDEVKKVALALVFVASLTTLPAYFSGEGAEEVVEHLPGIQEHLIEAHEEWAELALVAMILTGISALGGLVLGAKRSELLKTGSVVTLISGSVAFCLVGLTASAGGKIRHPEIRAKDSIGSTYAPDVDQDLDEGDDTDSE